MESSRLVRVVFAVLVVATVAAFFVTQALKTEVPVVLRFAVADPRTFSPNGDLVGDSIRLGFDLSEPAEVSFSIIDEEGNVVRRIFEDRELAGDTRHRFRWDGRDDEDDYVPDGTYRMRVVRRQEGRQLDSFKFLRVDTKPPRVRIASVEPNVVDPGDGPVRVRISYSGPSNGFPEFRVFRTDDGPPRRVRTIRGNVRSAVWRGDTISGNLAVDGDYTFQARVRDPAGNEALGPTPAPTRANTPPKTGVAVRRLSLEGPLAAIAAGGVAKLTVGPTPRKFNFVLSRFGDSKVIRRGRRRGGLLRIGIPERARTGVYMVRLRARGRRAVWPIAVAGLPPSARAAERSRPLLVLPVITWQGLNPWDSDLDGFADTLENASSIPAERPFLAAKLPPRFAEEVAPLLRFLDRERLAYDITTDLALARREGPALGNAPGVAFAGGAVWLPRQVRDRLLEEVVANGLRVVSLGRGGLKRSLALLDDDLANPSAARPEDVFGERTRAFETEAPAPLEAGEDGLGLFEGTDDLFGEFSFFERSEELPPEATLETAAGREPGEPAFVAYRLGKGIVIRPGTPQWAAQLEESALSEEVPRITRNIWRLLAR